MQHSPTITWGYVFSQAATHIDGSVLSDCTLRFGSAGAAVLLDMGVQRFQLLLNLAGVMVCFLKERHDSTAVAGGQPFVYIFPGTNRCLQGAGEFDSNRAGKGKMLCFDRRAHRHNLTWDLHLGKLAARGGREFSLVGS
jgi:hypothetical protein